MNNIFVVFSSLIILCFGTSVKSFAQNSTSLIPYPETLQLNEGNFSFKEGQLLFVKSQVSQFPNEWQFLQEYVFPATKFKKSVPATATIQLLKDSELEGEQYRLNIGEKGIQLIAGNASGMFFAIQTLQQLALLNTVEGNVSLPYLTIDDQPKFSWRGAHLDVARHFFSKEYIFKFIDLLALYKFNKFHFHLTDDQGWRMEIKKYPKLAEIGGWRTFNNQDSACIEKSKDNPDFALPEEHLRERNGKVEYGGFYTQKDLKEIVAYASQRHIEVIPEIDMPGHMYMATLTYPELVLDRVKAGWGKQFSIPICPCKPEAYDFIFNVLDEVMDVFPSRYIHIGADEVEKTSWEQSALCRELMKREAITDLHELQSYFVNRVNQYLVKKGKKAIGWDEVLDGGVDSTMTVMYWRGWEKDAPKKAVLNNHELIMTPTNPLYFDYLPNSSSLQSVYNFQPIDVNIPVSQRDLVLGAQANTWTEMIPSTARLEFMILPRLTALAERVWTDRELFGSYQNRVVDHFAIWQYKGYGFRMPDLSGFADTQVLVDGKSVLKVVNPLSWTKIYYTLDGNVPDSSDAVFQDSLVVTQPQHIKFSTISESGAKSDIYEVQIVEGRWHEGLDLEENSMKNGLHADFYKGTFKNTKAIDGDIVKSEVISNVSLSDTLTLSSFGSKIRGYIKVPTKEKYSFYFTVDDGGVLKIAEEIVVDNDGQHSPIMKSGQIALESGMHLFEVDFIEAGGGFTLQLLYSTEDDRSPRPIPDSWFVHLK